MVVLLVKMMELTSVMVPLQANVAAPPPSNAANKCSWSQTLTTPAARPQTGTKVARKKRPAIVSRRSRDEVFFNVVRGLIGCIR